MKLKVHAAVDTALIYVMAGIIGVGIYLLLTDFAMFIANTALVLLFCCSIYGTIAIFEWRLAKHTKASKRKSK